MHLFSRRTSLRAHQTFQTCAPLRFSQTSEQTVLCSTRQFIIETLRPEVRWKRFGWQKSMGIPVLHEHMILCFNVFERQNLAYDKDLCEWYVIMLKKKVTNLIVFSNVMYYNYGYFIFGIWLRNPDPGDTSKQERDHSSNTSMGSFFSKNKTVIFR